MDGALPGGTMADVWKHINRCRSCHGLYDALYLADEFYSAVATQAVPDEYRDSLRARMDEVVRDETSAATLRR
jgi:hypothetical protein